MWNVVYPYSEILFLINKYQICRVEWNCSLELEIKITIVVAGLVLPILHQSLCGLPLSLGSNLQCLTASFNTLRPRQNGRHFADDTFKRIFLNENARISIKISLKFVPQGPINNIPTLVQIMAWRRPGYKPLSGPMMVRLPTRICVTRPQWVKHGCGLIRHDNVIKWKHFPRYWPFVRVIHGWLMNSPHKGQWCGALMFSFICAWTNGCANNRHAGDLRHHRAHYDITVM